MEEVLSSLAHDATSNKVKTVRDACISATGKLRAVGTKSLLNKSKADYLGFRFSDGLFINRNGTRKMQPHELR